MKCRAWKISLATSRENYTQNLIQTHFTHTHTLTVPMPETVQPRPHPVLPPPLSHGLCGGKATQPSISRMSFVLLATARDCSWRVGELESSPPTQPNELAFQAMPNVHFVAVAAAEVAPEAEAITSNKLSRVQLREDSISSGVAAGAQSLSRGAAHSISYCNQSRKLAQSTKAQGQSGRSGGRGRVANISYKLGNWYSRVYARLLHTLSAKQMIISFEINATINVLPYNNLWN